MKLKDAYKPHNSPIYTEKLPIKTIQKKENQRPPLSHKMIKKAGKKFKKLTNQFPADRLERFAEKIPPFKTDKVSR